MSIRFRHPDGREVPFIEIRECLQHTALTKPEATKHADTLPNAHDYHEVSSWMPLVMGVGAVAVFGGLMAGFIIQAKNSEAQSLPRAPVSAKPLAEKTVPASSETVAKINAQIQAKLIADQLNKNIAGDMSHLKVTILNGAIIENAINLNTGKKITAPLVQNAILLSTVGNQRPDANGKFLKGAWLGVIGPQDTKKTSLAVSLFQFDSNTMNFVTSSEPTITATIFTTQVNLMGQGIAHETVAFDINDGSQLYNDNGRPIYVGESLTNKG